MIGEINLFGIYVPPLLLLGLLSLAAARALSWLLARLGLYRHVAHPALFDAALFVILLALSSALTSQWSY